MPGPIGTYVTATAGNAQLSFAITAYQSSNVYVEADVKDPFIHLYNESTYESQKIDLDVDASNQIISPFVVKNLTNNVEYQWEVVTNTGVDASGAWAGTTRPVGPPSKPVLGDAVYGSSEFTIPLSIQDNGSAISQLKVKVYNPATNKGTTKYYTSTDFAVWAKFETKGLFDISTSANSTWGDAITTDTLNVVVFVSAKNSVGDYSEVGNRSYSVLPVPNAPTSFTMSDSSKLGEGLVADVVVPVYSYLTATNMFIEIDACGNNAGRWTNVTRKQLEIGKLSYTFPVASVVGEYRTYAARVSRVLQGGQVVYSPYFATFRSIMNEQYVAGTLTATLLTNSGANSSYPADTFDYFKLSYEAGESSFGSRFITVASVDVSGTDINGIVDVSGLRPLAETNGIRIPAEGKLDMYCYVQHMQLTDSEDDNRTFSIAANGVKGYYSEDQIRAGASSSATDINAQVIISNTIIERTPLEKPDPVEAVTVYAGDTELTANWRVTSPAANQNKDPASFTVNLYHSNDAQNAIHIHSVNVTDYNHKFTNLENNVAYKVGVIARNDAGSATKTMSAVVVPIEQVLPSDTLSNIQLYSTPNTNSNGTKIEMTCTVTKTAGYKIDTIEIEEVDICGGIVDLDDVSGSNTATGLVGPISRKLVQNVSAQDYFGLKRYRFRAISNAVRSTENESSSVVHDTALYSEWKYAQINLTQLPRITTFTYRAIPLSKWAPASTEFKVEVLSRGLDIDETNSTIIAIPDMTSDASVLSLPSLVHSLTNPEYKADTKSYLYTLTVPYKIMDLDASTPNTIDAAALVLVSNALGQVSKGAPGVHT